MKKSILLLMSVCLFLCACGTKTDKEIEEDIASGVVLVQNKSYYEVVLSNGESIYFTGFDKDGDIDGLAFDEDSVTAQTSYGTGFFVSDEGQIATNAHVVSNMVADKEVNKSVAAIMDALKKIAAASYREVKQKLDQAEYAYDYANYSSEVSYDEYLAVKAIKEALEEKLSEIVNFYENVDNIRVSDSDIKYHNEVGIAYNNTFVTKEEDFVPCVVTKTDSEHDLAIIQLKDKSTPDDKFVFVIPEEDPLETYTFAEQVSMKVSDDKNSKLYMSSFNLGPTLAVTKEGVKSQFNSGTVSQKTADRLMYSIPTLPGSSGSPVVNQAEELVAINFAGINGTQNFNYGVRVKHLKALLEK